MPPTLQDYCNGELAGGGPGEIFGYPPTNNEANYRGRTFIANKSYTLTSVIVALVSVGYGNPPINTGTVYVDIWATDEDGKPTGSALDSGSFDGNTLTDEPTEIEIELSYSLVKDTKYAIIVRAPDAPNDEQEVIWGGGANPSDGGQNVYYSSDQSGPPGIWYVVSGSTSGWFETYGTFTLNKPINPTPSNSATDVTLDQQTITWEDGGGATSYDVYYGLTSGSLVKVSSGQAGLSFTIFGITNGSLYDYAVSRSWRVDAISGSSTVTGDVWTFTTIVFAPPLPTGVTLVDGVPTGTATGLNNMITCKKLVVAAANKLWYES